MDRALRLFIPIALFGVTSLLYGEVDPPIHPKALEQLTIIKKKATSLDFTGVFVFDSPSLNNAFSLSHLSGNPGKSKMSSIDGPEFDILFEGQSRSIHARDKHLLFPAIQYDALLWSSMALNDRLTDYYSIAITGQERACNRIADIVDIQSKTSDTYSLRLFLDQTTGAVLKKIIIDNEAQVLENYSFVDLKTGVSATSLSSSMPLIESYKKSSLQKQAVTGVAGNSLAFNWLPAGFTPIAADQQDQSDAVYQFSDGIFNITVFVESNEGPETGCHGKENQLRSFSGYCQSVMIDKKPYNLIVTGNVPLQTVKKIAENLKSEVL